VKTKIECTDDMEVYRLRDRLLPMVRLPEVLARPVPFTREVRAEITEKYRKEQEAAWKDHIDAGGEKNGETFSQSCNFAVVKAGNSRFGLIVDQILGTEEIVVKPMHWAVQSIGIYSGATIMGSGRCALILDVEGIARHTGILEDSFLDKDAEEIDKALKDEELQAVLLFRYGAKEQFAMALPIIRRIEPISMSDVERIDEKEFITIDGTSTRVLRLDQALTVSPVEEKDEMFLILPRHKRPVGLLISGIIDVEEISVQLNVESYMVDGLMGTNIIRDSMTLFIDIYRLIEIIEPEWFGEQQTGLLGKVGLTPETAKQILLLEDDSFFRRLIKGYLEAEGYKVTTAGDGRVGIGRFRETEFDLVVSDLEMPVMDGWEFIKHVRQGTHQQDIPAMALTSLDTDKDRKRAKECGFDRYEVKLDKERFLNIVAKLLDLEKSKT
jgi:two-component system chemotaxis sensor kinase CheA